MLRGRVPKRPPKPTETDEELAARARVAPFDGNRPNVSQRRALKRVTLAERDAIMDEMCAALPKRKYSELSGRTSHVCNKQARRYGIPIGGPSVDLGQVLQWIHEVIKEHGGRLLSAASDSKEDDPLLSGPSSAMLERCREEKWKMLVMEREAKEGSLLDVATIREAHVKIASILRTCGETLERQHGADAGQLLRDAIEDAGRAVEDMLSEGVNGSV